MIEQRTGTEMGSAGDELRLLASTGLTRLVADPDENVQTQERKALRLAKVCTVR